ncbi:MAG: hypothetical protein WC198_06085 [Victivallaceae bacterium]
MINARAEGGDIAEESATHGIKTSKAVSNNLLIAQQLIEPLTWSRACNRRNINKQPPFEPISIQAFPEIFDQPISTILHDICRQYDGRVCSRYIYSMRECADLNKVKGACFYGF